MTYFAGTGGSEMEQIAQQEPRISDALAAERFFSMDKEKRYAYFLEWKQIIDEESREAIAEARGKAKSKFQIAKNMLDDGASVEFAVRYTGLSLEEVQNLQNKTVPRV
jgi:hypothetical protein